MEMIPRKPNACEALDQFHRFVSETRVQMNIVVAGCAGTGYERLGIRKDACLVSFRLFVDGNLQES